MLRSAAAACLYACARDRLYCIWPSGWWWRWQPLLNTNLYELFFVVFRGDFVATFAFAVAAGRQFTPSRKAQVAECLFLLLLLLLLL